MYNLLKDPVLRVDKTDGKRHLATLPEVYAALMADEVVAFPAVRAHHRHAWHAFLVQVGTMAVYEASLRQPPRRSGAWLHILRGLTPDYRGDEPWRLAVEDPTVPAFMQPPATDEGEQLDFRNDDIMSPEQLDLIITAKNHDDKEAISSSAQPDDWAITLVALQTMEGYRGMGNYGITRMKGGLTSRPAFSLAPCSPHPGSHVRRDIVALLEARPDLIEAYPMVDGGIRLMWTVPWGGRHDEELQLANLDPFYVEVCRRVRLRTTPSGQTIRAASAGSKGYRVAMEDRTGWTEAERRKKPEKRTGLTGDPWTPYKTGKDGGSLTVTEDGFTYRRVTYCLTEWEHPVLLRATQAELDDAAPMQLVARAMVRGQGTSGGYHERVIPLSPQVVPELASNVSAGGAMGEVARERVQLVAAVQGILNYAVRMYRAGGKPTRTRESSVERMRPWRTALDRKVDITFFNDVQEELDTEPSERLALRRQWLLGVVEDARQILRDTIDTLSCSSSRKLRSMEQATSFFEVTVRSDEKLVILRGSPHQSEAGEQNDRSDQPERTETHVTGEKVQSPTTNDNPAQERPRQPADAAVSIAGELAAERYPRGDLARLRRMDPDRPGPSAFWDLLAKRDMSVGRALESKWALIVHGIALMTPLNSEGQEFRTAHDGYVSLGEALYTGGNPSRPTAFYSESRLERLLRSEGPASRHHIARICRMMRSVGARFNWREMARYVLFEGYDEEAAAEARRRILREYHRAQWKAKRQSGDEQTQQEVQA